jgi:serine/threonine-protein kinase
LMGSDLDGRADQYALAATAFHLLTGTAPYEHSNAVAVISQHLNATPPKVSDRRPELAHLDDVLSKALAKDPEERFARSRAFAAALRERAQVDSDSGRSTVLGLTVSAPKAGTQTQVAISRPPGKLAGQDASSEFARSVTAATRKRRARHLILVGATAAVIIVAATTAVVYAVQEKDTAAPGPPSAVLDGTYEIAMNFEQQTLNGAPAPVTSRAPRPTAAPDNQPQPASALPPSKPSSAQDNIHLRAYWAYRSTCSASGCVAEGVMLDPNDHTKPDKSGDTSEKRFVEGEWLSKPVKVNADYERCSIDNGKQVPGSDTESVTSSWRPQPDGRLIGMSTQTVITDECFFEGRVTQVPVTVRRIGDVPDGVELPDPAAASPAPPPADPPKVGQPTLEGTYRVDYDGVNQRRNGVIKPVQEAVQTEWWAFRSRCGSLGCVATAVELDQNNNQVSSYLNDVLHFADGRWNSTPDQLLEPTCTVTKNGVTGPEQSPETDTTKTWTPQPDGSLRGLQTYKITTNECGQQGRVEEYPFLATRVGSIPAGVVVADPQLFIS